MCLANKTTPIFFGDYFDENYPKNCGAKLSDLWFWYQIVRFYYVGAKLSVFTMLVPNCSFLLCWCQIVCLPSWRQIVPCQIARCLILVPNCPFSYFGAKLSFCLLGVKLFYHQCYSTLMVFLFNRIVPVEPSWFRIFMSPLVVCLQGGPH